MKKDVELKQKRVADEKDENAQKNAGYKKY